MSKSRIRVAIIGSGFSGLCMALRLKRAGSAEFTLFERSNEVGGVWRDNSYPGCACDIPSHLYSLSFAPYPGWSRRYSPWSEIQEYLVRVTDENDLRPHIRFGEGITEARYDESDCTWTLTTSTGRSHVFDVVVNATGSLNKPVIPDIPGRESFAGESFHSSHWNHDVDLAGKRVAVIGTGASAIQIVPGIAGEVARLDLYQRTPPWIVPRLDHPISGFSKALFRWFPPSRWLYRAWLYGYQEVLGIGLVTDIGVHRAVEGLARWNIRRAITDPALREQVTPDYRIGCKRILVSDDYYPALARDNVEIITTGVTGITASGVVTEQGEREVDVIVYATGFSATTYLAPMKFFGPGGVELGERWGIDEEAYFGLATAGFPNLFFISGPNAGIGHNSIIFIFEAQVDYIMKALRTLRRTGARSIAVREDVERRFNEELQRRLSGAVWSSGCGSWYLNQEGKNTTLWPGLNSEFWLRTRRFRDHDFEMA